jgi:hypothetical protein
VIAATDSAQCPANYLCIWTGPSCRGHFACLAFGSSDLNGDSA